MREIPPKFQVEWMTSLEPGSVFRKEGGEEREDFSRTRGNFERTLGSTTGFRAEAGFGWPPEKFEQHGGFSGRDPFGIRNCNLMLIAPLVYQQILGSPSVWTEGGKEKEKRIAPLFVETSSKVHTFWPSSPILMTFAFILLIYSTFNPSIQLNLHQSIPLSTTQEAFCKLISVSSKLKRLLVFFPFLVTILLLSSVYKSYSAPPLLKEVTQLEGLPPTTLSPSAPPVSSAPTVMTVPDLIDQHIKDNHVVIFSKSVLSWSVSQQHH